MRTRTVTAMDAASWGAAACFLFISLAAWGKLLGLDPASTAYTYTQCVTENPGADPDECPLPLPGEE